MTTFINLNQLNKELDNLMEFRTHASQKYLLCPSDSIRAIIDECDSWIETIRGKIEDQKKEDTVPTDKEKGISVEKVH